MSAYSSSSLHSGHLTSVHILLSRSERMEVSTHSRHAVGGWEQLAVTEKSGNPALFLVSVQMVHSVSFLVSARTLCRVITTSVVSAARWYRCPKLTGLLETVRR
jgi:hypothetical protein